VSRQAERDSLGANVWNGRQGSDRVASGSCVGIAKLCAMPSGVCPLLGNGGENESITPPIFFFFSDFYSLETFVGPCSVKKYAFIYRTNILW